MSGFIALHREAFTHPVLKDPDRFRAWFWLVAHAAWKQTRHDARGRTITVDRGQICVGREQLAKEWKWSPSAVERFLEKLETEQMIGRETGHGKSLITICNYEKYQDNSAEAGQSTGQSTGQKSRSDRNRTEIGQKTGQLKPAENCQFFDVTGHMRESDMIENRTAKEQENNITIEEEPNGSPSIDAGARASAGDDRPRKARKPKSHTVPIAKIPDWIPAEPWGAFLDMRKGKRAKPTDRAIILIIGKLTELQAQGHDPGKVLDQSTLNNWTDVYPLKDQSHGSSHVSGRSGSGDRADHRGSARIDGATRAWRRGLEPEPDSGAADADRRCDDFGAGTGGPSAIARPLALR